MGINFGNRGIARSIRCKWSHKPDSPKPRDYIGDLGSIDMLDAGEEKRAWNRINLGLLGRLRNHAWQKSDRCGLRDWLSRGVPGQRTKFSKRQFAQPQLLAVLCRMRCEDWTFREAEVRLSEPAELRSALDLRPVPDYTTLYRFLARLDPEDVAGVMKEIVRRMPGRWRSPVTVAVDATGLAQAAVSSCFIRRVEHFGEKQRSGRTG